MKTICGKPIRNGITIYTNYDGRDIARGEFVEDKGIFYRDDVPLIFDRYVSLEPDVIMTLKSLDCRLIKFYLRDGRKIKINIKDFIRRSKIKNIGNPNRRKQYFYDVKVHFEQPIIKGL